MHSPLFNHTSLSFWTLFTVAFRPFHKINWLFTDKLCQFCDTRSLCDVLSLSISTRDWGLGAVWGNWENWVWPKIEACAGPRMSATWQPRPGQDHRRTLLTRGPGQGGKTNTRVGTWYNNPPRFRIFFIVSVVRPITHSPFSFSATPALSDWLEYDARKP